MKKEVRLSDIAKRLGVSTVTVSNALSGQKGVSEEMRDRIKATALAMGYQARSGPIILNKKIIHIGIIISEKYMDAGNYPSFYWKMYQEFSICAREKNCLILFEVLERGAEETLGLPLFMEDGKVQGIAVIGEISSKYLECLLERANVPVVFVDFKKKGMPVDSVLANNFYGMYEVVSSLIALGHREIAYVGTLLVNNSITDRYYGYCKALLENGIGLNLEWVIDDRDMDGQLGGIRLPERMPSAFACNCDLAASEVVKLLGAAGYRVPENVSVAGFDNYLYEGLCEVKITTYEVDTKEMVRIALEDIIARLEGRLKEPGKMHIVSGRLVMKDSVKDVRPEAAAGEA